MVSDMVFHFHMQGKQCSSDNPKAEQYTAKSLESLKVTHSCHVYRKTDNTL